MRRGPKAAEAKSDDGWVEFCANAAVMELPGASLTFQTTKAEAARSGDIGYCYGAYQRIFNDPMGKSIVDTWNTDTPLAP